MRANFLSRLNYKFFLIAAVALGIFVRLYGLDIQSLWYDEIATYIYSLHGFPKFLTIMLREVHPPLYQLFSFYWIKMFGYSEIILRMPSAVAGILAVFCIYPMSKKLFGTHTAVSATILMSLSSAAIYYSQEARSYSFLLLFSTISTLLWLSILKKMTESDLSKKELALFGITGIINCYLHYFGAALIFFQLFYLLAVSIKFKKNIKEIAVLSVITALSFLPWFFIHLIFLKTHVAGKFWIAKKGISFFLDLADFIFNKKLLWILILPLFLNIKTIIRSFAENSQKFLIYSLICLCFIPVFAVFIISFNTPLLVVRYFIILLPAYYLLISLLLSLCQGFDGIKGNIFVFAISLASFVLFLFVPGNNISAYQWNLSRDFNESYYKPCKQGWREASKYVMENYEPGSVIFVDSDLDLYVYYFNRFTKNNTALSIYSYKSRNGVKKIFIDNNVKRAFIFASFNKLPSNIEKTLKKASSEFKIINFTGIYMYDCSIKR